MAPPYHLHRCSNGKPKTSLEKTSSPRALKCYWYFRISSSQNNWIQQNNILLSPFLLVSSALGYQFACYTTDSVRLNMKARMESEWYQREYIPIYTGLYQTITHPKRSGQNLLLPGQNRKNTEMLCSLYLGRNLSNPGAGNTKRYARYNVHTD